MHCFIHIITDGERIVDPDGEEFVDLETARAEASQSARDLMARQLMAGRPVPFGWRAQVADGEGAILLTISFAELVFGKDLPQHSFAPVRDEALIARAQALVARIRRNDSDIKQGIGELWSQLRTLARMNAVLGRTIS